MTWRDVQSLTKMGNTPVIASPRAKKMLMMMPQKARTSMDVNSVPGDDERGGNH